ncbi:hypothetical protein J6590_027715 [Homalodisca vitripennis]|nr:hypothetical protein J6590_027715 [Homalodisca vitripennis]
MSVSDVETIDTLSDERDSRLWESILRQRRILEAPMNEWKELFGRFHHVTNYEMNSAMVRMRLGNFAGKVGLLHVGGFPKISHVDVIVTHALYSTLAKGQPLCPRGEPTTVLAHLYRSPDDL